MAEKEYYVDRTIMYDEKTATIIAVNKDGRWVKEMGLNRRMDRVAERAIAEIENESKVREQFGDLEAQARAAAVSTPDGSYQADQSEREVERTEEAEADTRAANANNPDLSTQAPAPTAQDGFLDPEKIPFQDFLDSNEKEVSSSNIQSVNYDASRQILRVMFHKGRGYYFYGDVTYTEYMGLLNADSVGKYFHQRIKNKPMFHR